MRPYHAQDCTRPTRGAPLSVRQLEKRIPATAPTCALTAERAIAIVNWNAALKVVIETCVHLCQRLRLPAV